MPSHNSIYCILNKSNDKRYIGKTSNLNKRFIMHRCLLNTNKHWNEHLQRAWNKDGENNFYFIILEENILDQDLNDRERECIAKYNTQNDNFGYNLTIGGDGLHNPAQETRDKISKTLKIRYRDGEKKVMKGKCYFDYWIEYFGIEKATKMKKDMCEKLSEKAKQQWDNLRDKMIEAQQNARPEIVSQETRNKMSESAKKRWSRRNK